MRRGGGGPPTPSARGSSAGPARARLITFRHKNESNKKSNTNLANPTNTMSSHRKQQQQPKNLSSVLSGIILPWALSGAMDSAEGIRQASKHINAELESCGVPKLTDRQCRDLLANPDRLRD